MAKTNTPQIKIVDVSTGEEIERPMNTDELAQLEADKAVEVEYKAKAQADAEAKAALLARLGLTEDELKTILG